MMIYKIHIKSIHIEGGHGAIHIMYNISRLGVVVHGAFYIVILLLLLLFFPSYLFHTESQSIKILGKSRNGNARNMITMFTTLFLVLKFRLSSV